MVEYAIRYDDPGQDLHDQITLFLKEKSSVYAFCRELGQSGENPHYHWYVCTGIPIKSIRNKFTRMGIKGNGGYSCTQVRDTLKYIGYLVKQDLIESNIDDAYMDEAREYDAKVKEEIKEKKSKKKNVKDDLFAYLDSKEYKGNDIQEKVITGIIEYFLENDKLIRTFQIEAYYRTYMCRLSPMYYQSVIDKILGTNNVRFC